ncbi:MAG TPA: SAM-dependent methyltransferase, partial [Gammaproteobacteria bacterium]|nr:SAM-dependent methyltransferase [Gammaproteobacteria bacterium]
CGGGITSAALAAAVGPRGEVLGADISETILKVARSRYENIANLKFTTADAEVFSFVPQNYDLITSRFGVMFFASPNAAFRNIHQTAKPSGRMVYICWRTLVENPWMGAPAAAAFTVLPPPEKPEPGTPGPFSLADPKLTTKIMADAGFRDIKFTPVDEPVNLGEIEPVLHFMTTMGPAAEPLKSATDADREAALAAMRVTLEQHNTKDGVIMPSAIWVVEAKTH